MKCAQKCPSVPKSGVSERAEDLEYVRTYGLPVDVKYYLDAMKRPLVDIFGPILGGNKKVKKILFTGEHMNHIVKKIPTLPQAFRGFTVTRRCKQCKSPLKDGTCTICSYI